MSSKATKSVNKRVSSGGKHRDKKGGNVNTPEASTHGTASVCSEGTGQEKPPESGIDDVLRGEDVYALSIREEDLCKIHPPKLPSVKSIQTKRVVVRRTQPKEASTKHKRVTVLHPLPPGTATSEVKPLSTVEATPRFTKDGAVISHSLLGPSKDFATNLKDRGLVGSTSELTRPPPVVLPKVTKLPRVRRMTYEKTIVPREQNALEHWDRSMELRKSQQQSLCDKLGSSPEDLAMNQGDGFRKVQEERMLVERAMPSVNYGKGYRVGSEFWSQQVRLGNETTGINITLTRTERGLPPELEFVGVPTMIRQQKGEVERNAPLHYTWKQSSYLSTRTEELGNIINDIQPFRPDTSALQVVGHAPGNQEEGGEDQMFIPEPSSRMRLRTDSLDSLGGSGDSLSPSPSDEGDTQNLLDFQPDITTQPIVGPALMVGGCLLKWEGPPPQKVMKDTSKMTHSRAVKSEITLTRGRMEIELQNKASTASLRDFTQEQKNAINFERRQELIELRVTFENCTQEMSTSYLEMHNCGTAAVYYSWQPVPKPNPLGTVQAGDTQRFYFDTRGGVLLPDQKLSFPFVFKSPNAGIFSEVWSLHTGPVLCRGRPVILTLKGVAFQEDIYKDKREEIERLLSHRMAVAAAESIVNRLAAAITTPPRTLEPFETTVSEEDIFREKNPSVYFRYNVVQQLKRLYDSILRPELLQDEDLVPEPSSKSDKGVTGKKGEEKSAGGKKQSGKEKDKKGAKPKEEPAKETPPESTPVVSQVPDWDLSIESLQEVVVSVEENESREDKLKLLSSLVGALSFPPPTVPRLRLYNIGYEALCEVVDQITEVSTRLRVIMGLPVKELQCSSGMEQEETSPTSQPSSPALPSTGKGKRGSKDAKKSDPKQKVVAAATKDKERAGSSKIKASKSKTTASPKGQRQTPSETPSTAVTSVEVEVDPILEEKYKENLYTAVYDILGSAVETMSAMFEELDNVYS